MKTINICYLVIAVTCLATIFENYICSLCSPLTGLKGTSPSGPGRLQKRITISILTITTTLILLLKFENHPHPSEEEEERKKFEKYLIGGRHSDSDQINTPFPLKSPCFLSNDFISLKATFYCVCAF